MKKIIKVKNRIRNITFLSALNSIYRNYFQTQRKKFGFIHPTAFFRQPLLIKGIENVYMHENTSILGHSKILTTNAKFVMKKNSGAAEGFTVVTGNHFSMIGQFFRNISDEMKPRDLDKDIIVEEDVWIATNVTLLAGVTIGRGSVIGSGSVVRTTVPPYAIVTGNPSKVVGFKFAPEEILEHEKKLYPEKDRLPLELLQKNYDKHFIKRINDIKNYLK